MVRQRSDQSPRQRTDPIALLDYLAQFQQDHGGRSPSQREIQRSLGISAPSVVHYHLHRLANAGLLTITLPAPGYTAELALTTAGQLRLQQWRAQRQQDPS